MGHALEGRSKRGNCARQVISGGATGRVESRERRRRGERWVSQGKANRVEQVT